MNIYIDPQELATRIENLNTLNKDIEQIMCNIERLVLDIGYEWQGKSALVYQVKILYLKKQYQALNDFITDYCFIAKSIINDYEESEKTIKHQLEV